MALRPDRACFKNILSSGHRFLQLSKVMIHLMRLINLSFSINDLFLLRFSLLTMCCCHLYQNDLFSKKMFKLWVFVTCKLLHSVGCVDFVQRLNVSESVVTVYN